MPPLEYAVVLVILVGVIVWGFLVGVVIGLVLAVVLFAVSYGRIELVREVAFGETYRSNVDRPASERAELRELSDRVQLLRVSGFVFFGSTNRLLERVRHRMEQAAPPPRFLVIDLRRVTGVDSSAVVAFVKVMRLAEAAGSEIVFTGASDPVRAQLARGGVDETEGLVSFEPDLDRGLQRCEDALLSAPSLDEARREHPAAASPDGLPPGLAAHLERVSLPAGTVLLHQDEPPGDVYVLESGRLAVETVTPEGTRLRLRTLRPGVVVGEITLYTDVPRTADVVAEIPSVVLRIGRGVDRAARGRGAGARRGAAPVARDDDGGATDRPDAGAGLPPGLRPGSRWIEAGPSSAPEDAGPQVRDLALAHRDPRPVVRREVGRPLSFVRAGVVQRFEVQRSRPPTPTCRCHAPGSSSGR